MESDVLDMLQPHRMLRVLTIRNYGDLKFSAWVGDSLFSNMVLLRLEDCFLCELLPPLGQLPSLRKLYIRNMSGVYSVGPEFYGEGRQPFPLLETLEFHDMQSWTEWSAWEKDKENGVFPCLKMLCISGCPRLEGRLPETLDLLSELVIRGCEQLVVSIANYKKVQKLDFHDCKRVVHDSSVEFELLEAVELSSISEFTLQSDEFLRGLTKLKDLCINGCEKLTSLWQNEDRLLQYLISLPRLVIKNNSNLFKLHHLISLQELHIYKCNSHLVQLDHLRFLEELHIYQCPTLISFQEVGLPHSLRNIKIEWCESLAYFARFQVPPSLRRIEIFKCFNLKSLLEVEEAVEGSSSSSFGIQEEASGLEYLRIVGCNSLTSLSFRDHLPRTLKHLLVESCQQLESIVGSFNNYSSLEEVDISGCLKLKSFPEGLSNLGNLQSLSVRYCGSLVSFPRGGFPSSSISNLRKIEIDCYNLKALPQGVHRLYSLQILKIHYCEGFMPFLEEGLPSNLIQLQVQGLKSCKQLLEWGLYRLTSLRKLVITGTDPELVSFPPGNNMVLPESLIGFQFLTSLESLAIQKCRKLKFMPEEGLPLSLRQLLINGCPPLQKKCERSGPYWRSIVHIPFIKIAYSSDKFSYFSGPDSDTE